MLTQSFILLLTLAGGWLGWRWWRAQRANIVLHAEIARLRARLRTHRH